MDPRWRANTLCEIHDHCLRFCNPVKAWTLHIILFHNARLFSSVQLFFHNTSNFSWKSKQSPPLTVHDNTSRLLQMYPLWCDHSPIHMYISALHASEVTLHTIGGGEGRRVITHSSHSRRSFMAIDRQFYCLFNTFLPPSSVLVCRDIFRILWVPLVRFQTLVPRSLSSFESDDVRSNCDNHRQDLETASAFPCEFSCCICARVWPEQALGSSSH